MTDIEINRMSLLDHLQELRKRLLFSFLAVCIGSIACWFFYQEILDLLLDPYCSIRASSLGEGIFGSGCELLVTDPLEPFSVRLTVAGYGGLILSIPIILWQAWRFIAPGLLKREKRWALPFIFSGVLLFAAGAFLAYWSIPRALDFLVGIGGPDLVSMFSPARYIGFVIKMIVAFGVGFEFPLFLIFLQLMGVITPDALRKSRRYAIVGIVALVAVLTPSGDPFTLLVLSVPMIIFYELSILFGAIRKRKLRSEIE